MLQPIQESRGVEPEESEHEKICEDCFFAEWEGGIGARYTCRRYAPLGGGRDELNAFPKVRSRDWCGEFRYSEDSVKSRQRREQWEQERREKEMEERREYYDRESKTVRW